MTIFEFELNGKFAHWKKFYTNSSSLTYYFPTRTNIIGILASILGMARDSYYQSFNKDNLDVAVSLKSKVKKKITSVNYINTKGKDNSHTQIKLEILLPQDLRKDVISYRIYIKAKSDQSKDKIKEIIERVKNKRLGFGVYLGQRAFRGDILFIKEHNEKLLEEAIEVSTVCPKENIEGDLDFNNTFYVSDIIPIDFNDKREIQKTEEVIYNLNGNIKLKEGKIRGIYQIGDKNIIFL